MHVIRIIPCLPPSSGIPASVCVVIVQGFGIYAGYLYAVVVGIQIAGNVFRAVAVLFVSGIIVFVAEIGLYGDEVFTVGDCYGLVDVEGAVPELHGFICQLLARSIARIGPAGVAVAVESWILYIIFGYVYPIFFLGIGKGDGCRGK